MTNEEFEKSIKQYYFDKQKEKTETIYVDIEKLVIERAVATDMCINSEILELEREKK